MKSEQGPQPTPYERLSAARTPPIKRSGRATAAVVKKSSKPVRRPAAASQARPEGLPPISRAVVEQSLAAEAQGAATELPAEGRRYTVRIAPSALDVIQQSGLSPSEIQQLLLRLANVLGSEETTAALPQVPEMPDLKMYKSIVGKSRTVFLFRFLLAVLSEQSVVVVAAGFHRRERAI